jgi:large subunit ribosomal protein L24
MAMKKIKRDDEVVVIAGKDKGKRGKVLKVLDDNRLLVSGVQIMKKHQKPNPQAGVAGGIIEKEAPIQVSNVAIFNSATNKADRVGFKVQEDNTKIRVFKSNGEAVDA